MISVRLFQKLLLQWSHENPRELPWIGEQDPYKIWISEIMLQQTKAETVIPFYNRFISQYPNVSILAESNENELIKYWEGLGYYSRIRNIHKAAQYLLTEYGGMLPRDIKQLKALPGIGSYTAAAIASFAFNQDYVAIDGNVIRVLSRVYGLAYNPQSSNGRFEFQEMADSLLPKYKSKQFNQALMDFGSSICTPTKPKCTTCPFAKRCIAHTQNRIAEFPIKKNKLILKKRYFHYFILENNQHEVWIHKRSRNDIWRGLHQFLLIESETSKLAQDITISGLKLSNQIKLGSYQAQFQQKLTHQHIFTYFYAIKNVNKAPSEGFFLVKKENLRNYAFPKAIIEYLTKNY